MHTFTLLFILVSITTSSSYETIGIKNQKPYVGQCMNLKDDCYACLMTGCIYYELQPVLEKTMCFPQYKHPPLREMIIKAIYHENNCSTPRNIPKEPMLMNTPTANPELSSIQAVKVTQSGSSVLLYVGVIVLLAAIVIFGIIIMIWRSCRRHRGIGQLNNPDIRFNNIN